MGQRETSDTNFSVYICLLSSFYVCIDLSVRPLSVCLSVCIRTLCYYLFLILIKEYKYIYMQVQTPQSSLSTYGRSYLND